MDEKMTIDKDSGNRKYDNQGIEKFKLKSCEEAWVTL